MNRDELELRRHEVSGRVVVDGALWSRVLNEVEEVRAENARLKTLLEQVVVGKRESE